MNRNLFILLALAVTLLSGVAHAQSLSTRALPAPIQRGWAADGRIFMEVGPLTRLHTDEKGAALADSASYRYGEHFGNRLGDIIPIRVKIYCVLPQSDKQRKVELDFSALKAGRLTVDPDPQNDPDWVLADAGVLGEDERPLYLPKQPSLTKVKLVSGVEADAEVWDITMFVQTKRQPEPMLFWVEFAANTELTPNGSKDWKKVSTPDFIISQSRTADDGKDLSMGNTEVVAQQPPVVLGWTAVALGSLLVLVPICNLGIRALRRRFAKGKQLDPAEKAWLVFKPVFAAGLKDGRYSFDNGQVREIVAALKEFFGITYGVKQLQERRFDFDDGESLLTVLTALEHGVLECGAELSAERYTELVARINRLCPQP